MFVVPGTEYNYSNFGYTLLSAVMEKAAGRSYEKLMAGFWQDLGMSNTYLDDKDTIIYKRAWYEITITLVHFL